MLSGIYGWIMAEISSQTLNNQHQNDIPNMGAIKPKSRGDNSHAATALVALNREPLALTQPIWSVSRKNTPSMEHEDKESEEVKQNIDISSSMREENLHPIEPVMCVDTTRYVEGEGYHPIPQELDLIPSHMRLKYHGAESQQNIRTMQVRGEIINAEEISREEIHLIIERELPRLYFLSDILVDFCGEACSKRNKAHELFKTSLTGLCNLLIPNQELSDVYDMPSKLYKQLVKEGNLRLAIEVAMLEYAKANIDYHINQILSDKSREEKWEIITPTLNHLRDPLFTRPPEAQGLPRYNWSILYCELLELLVTTEPSEHEMNFIIDQVILHVPHNYQNRVLMNVIKHSLIRQNYELANRLLNNFNKNYSKQEAETYIRQVQYLYSQGISRNTIEKHMNFGSLHNLTKAVTRGESLNLDNVLYIFANFR